jgi:predicted  nucleic acid-binding Zn-ribbon protein
MSAKQSELASTQLQLAKQAQEAKDLARDITALKERCTYLQSQLETGCDDFESVLRHEFELMRKKYEAQVQELKELIDKDRLASSHAQTCLVVELDRLKVVNQSLSSRLLQKTFNK